MKENKPHSNYGHKKNREDIEQGKETSYRSNKFAHKRKTQGALPSPEVLRAYEALSEGAAAQLLEMAEAEQMHRHEWEDAYLRSYTKSHRIGLLFGFFLALAIISASLWLGFGGNNIAAAALSISGFTALIINTIVSAKTRRFEKKPFMRHQKKVETPVTDE